MERDYSAIEAMYDSNLRPGMNPSPVAEPYESDEQIAKHEEAVYAPPPEPPAPIMPSGINLNDRIANFQGITFDLEDEDVEAIQKVLAERVVKNLENMADEWRTKFIKQQ